MRGCRLTKLVENFEFRKWNAIFLDEKLKLNGIPWAPFTFLINSSSGAHFFVVRHYARSGLARDDLLLSRIRSTAVERNAQVVLFQASFFAVRERRNLHRCSVWWLESAQTCTRTRSL